VNFDRRNEEHRAVSAARLGIIKSMEYFTTKQVADKLGVSFATAKAQVKRWVLAGLVGKTGATIKVGTAIYDVYKHSGESK
jgi:predicted transcriptional regulator